MSAFPHYFKALPPGCKHVDVYRVLSLFEVADPALQHAVKKLLCAGARGAKDQGQDIAEAIATLQRWQQMRAEEQEWRRDAKERQLNTSQEIQDRLDRIPVYAPAPAPAPEDAERAAYLARWKDAPKGATHLSEDIDGCADWWEGHPSMGTGHDDGIWVGGSTATWAGAAITSILGSVRCEPRPVQGVGP